MTNFEQNIRRAFDASSKDDREHGMSWYAGAKAVADSLTPGEPWKGAGIIAALSPMTSWPENLRKARMIVETGTSYGLKSNVAKAQQIFAGSDPLTVLKGNKVRAFYMNIMDITSDETVTIDRHAIDIAHGRTMSDDERAPYFGKRKYAELVAAYRNVAFSLDITGAQLQAIVWVYWRRNVIRAFHGD